MSLTEDMNPKVKGGHYEESWLLVVAHLSTLDVQSVVIIQERTNVVSSYLAPCNEVWSRSITRPHVTRDSASPDCKYRVRGSRFEFDVGYELRNAP